MPRIHLLAGLSWAALFEQKNLWLQQARQGTAGGVLVLLPAEWGLDRKAELLRDHLAGCSVLTTEELIEGYLRRTAEKLPRGLGHGPVQESAGRSSTSRILLDKHAAGYLLDSILKKAALDSLKEVEPAGHEQPQSGYLNIETFRRGYVRALSEYLCSFRQAHHEDLLAVLELAKRGPLSAKEKDLVDIHAEFERLLEQRGLYDYRRGVDAFLEEGEGVHGARAPFVPETNLVIAGFSRLSSLDRRLLLGLVGRFQCSTLLYCSNPRASAAVFRVQDCFESFLERLRESSADIQEAKLEDTAGNRGSALFPLAELIFQDDKKDRLSRASGTVKLIQAEDRYSEVTSMARHILEIRRQGIDYGRIRLVVSDYELYAALLLEVFPRYGIAYRLNKGAPLKFFPLAGIVQSLVSHAVTPIPYPLRERIFSSPYVSFSCVLQAEELVRFAQDKGIPIESRSIRTAVPEPRSSELDYRWCLEQQRRAARAFTAAEKLEPVQLAARYLQQRFARDPQACEREMLKLLVNYYILSQAERALRAWRSKMTPSAFWRALQKLIDRFRLAENARIQGRGVEDQVFQCVAARDEEVLKTFDLLGRRFQAHFALLSGDAQDGEPQYPLTTLVWAFTALLSDPQLALFPSALEGVAVYAPSDVPHSFYPVTLVGGLVDGEFPAKEPFNFLAPRREDPGGGLLPGESLLIDQERQNLYQIMAATTERLYLYFPFSDGGKKLLCSPFVAEIERCLAAPASGGRAQEGSPEDLSSCGNSREKLIFAGRNLDRAYSEALPVLQALKGSSAERFRHILDTFRCDGLRDSPDTLGRFDGVFESSADPASASARHLGRQMDEAAFIEVEQLERYAGCPLRFLLDDLMRLKPDCQLDYHPDKTERGVLLKNILLGYNKAVAAASAQAEVMNGERKTPENAEQILRTIAEQAFARMPSQQDDLFSGSFKRSVLRGLAETAPGEDGEIGGHGALAAPAAAASPGETHRDGGSGGGKTRPGLLCAFLAYEREAPDLIRPYLAGLELGDFQAAGVPVRIAIQRADITSGGEYLIIYAYSISDPGDPGGINKGLRFQAPLMILAMRRYLQQKGLDKQVGGCGTYLVRNPRMIKRGGYFALQKLQASRRAQVSPERPLFSGQRQYGFLPAASFEQELEETARRVGRIDELIRKGRFNPPLCAVRDQICGNCAFSRICRKDQLRLDRIYTAIDGEQLYKPRRRVELAAPELESEE